MHSWWFLRVFFSNPLHCSNFLLILLSEASTHIKSLTPHLSPLTTMRLVIQRASHASVTIDGQKKSQIGCGLVILVGICDEDTEEDIDWLVRKVTMLRVFDDEMV